MKIFTETKHQCLHCMTKFYAASLGDFCYGVFLLWAGKNNCLYLEAFTDMSYQEVIEIIGEIKKEGSIEINDTTQLLQAIYGELACDNDELGNSYHLGLPSCPNCGSTDMDLIGDKKMGEIIVYPVTHNFWNSLNETEKKARFLKIINSETHKRNNW